MQKNSTHYIVKTPAKDNFKILAILVLMGINRKTEYKDYWKDYQWRSNISLISK